MNEQQRPDDDRDTTGRRPETRTPGFETAAKSRSAYVDPGGSQSTKELRETARRRREAEEKLQQHLMEAKEHAHQESDHHESDRQADVGKDDAAGKDDKADNFR
ncbi:hypothetical protein F8G81_02665 [Arthrobacter sp. CDRTa11]|uniref:hypothetical protein n=1 Tax=Arthrobacter sp. CDRTa11 TaxID=2651199 RepID=UPI0022659797|nr:hypothetical protein [Arthrobacter sp. CDRTa11]UZX01649.1 hypothetical protein F8G81_02665 [Arthrobacter sp. CDRTa11]